MKPEPETEKTVDEPTVEPSDSMKDAELRMRAIESFLFAQTNNSEEE